MILFLLLRNNEIVFGNKFQNTIINMKFRLQIVLQIKVLAIAKKTVNILMSELLPFIARLVMIHK